MHSSILGDDKKAKEIYEFIIKKYPQHMEAYHAFWRYMVRKGNHDEASKIATLALEASEHSSVPTSMWVDTRIMRAKSYIFKNDIAKAISTLKDICFILSPFPVESLPYIDSILLNASSDDLF